MISRQIDKEKKKAESRPRKARQEVVSSPTRNTRNRGGRVEFGFDDLERVERRARAERVAERARVRAKRG